MAIDLYWTGFFQAGVDGKTGLVDVVIYVYELSTGTLVVDGASCTEVGNGVYRYTQSDADQAEDHVGVMHTDDATVSAKDVMAVRLNRQVAYAVWDEILTASTHNISTSAGRRLRAVPGILIEDGVAQGPGTGTNQIQLSAEASSVDGSYDPSLIQIISGTGEKQCRAILEYDGDTKTATVDRDWKVLPDATSEYQILADPGREHVNEGLAAGGDTNTITLNSLASSEDDVYIGQVLFIRSGTGSDQACRIIDYDGATRVATVCSDWTVVPDTTSAYVMLPSGFLNVAEFVLVAAAAVWNKLMADHDIDGSFGNVINDLTEVSSGLYRFTAEALAQGDVASAASIWAYATRTLTQAAASVTAAVSGSTITIHRGDTFVGTLTGLSMSGASKVWLTVKYDHRLPDTESVIQVDSVTGLLCLNCSGEVSADDASLAVDEENGTLTITISEVITSQLKPCCDSLRYDVQTIVGGVVSTITSGALDVTADYTRAIE